MGAKYTRECKSDSADYYLKELFSICDHALKKKFDENMFNYKIKGLYLRDGNKKAREYLSKQLKEHPNNSMLRYMEKNWEVVTNNFYK